MVVTKNKCHNINWLNDKKVILLENLPKKQKDDKINMI
jgi:hypothetical protein